MTRATERRPTGRRGPEPEPRSRIKGLLASAMKAFKLGGGVKIGVPP
jgi:hypothetical protein